MNLYLLTFFASSSETVIFDAESQEEVEELEEVLEEYQDTTKLEAREFKEPEKRYII